MKTGAEIKVPLLIATGDTVKVDTRDDGYLGSGNSGTAVGAENDHGTGVSVLTRFSYSRRAFRWAGIAGRPWPPSSRLAAGEELALHGGGGDGDDAQGVALAAPYGHTLVERGALGGLRCGRAQGGQAGRAGAPRLPRRANITLSERTVRVRTAVERPPSAPDPRPGEVDLIGRPVAQPLPRAQPTRAVGRPRARRPR
ncbi:hypothetical protein ACFUJY_22435 [Streptomyces sp. NPDC057249]|uniref:hypothetical protein n=1 Tax=Streptomyces sp. NPDC057249 TaxID=3346067 RepID=UPI00362D59F9